MLLNAFLALLPLLFIGLASEVFWRAKVLRGELGRKFIHIFSGIWVSLWPLFLSMNAVALLAAGLLLGLIISRNLHIFHAVYDVKRRTFGEYFYPLAILTCAILAQTRWHFSLAILLLAVADGLAAVVGTHFKKKSYPYKFLTNTKSLLGTATYFICAVLILIVVGRIYANEMALTTILLFSLFAALMENVLPYGSDNLVIPLLVVLILPVSL